MVAQDGGVPLWRLPARLYRGGEPDHIVGHRQRGPDVQLRQAEEDGGLRHVPGALLRPAGVETALCGGRPGDLRGGWRRPGHHLGPGRQFS